MAVTVKDVAAKCGLPVQLVGRVLNDYADIGADIRGRVLETALAMGYSLESAPRLNRTRNLGVLFTGEGGSGLTHPFFAALLNAFKAEAEAHGYDVTFINHNIRMEGATYLEHCRYRNVDGVCLATADFYSPEVAELLNSEIPCVTVDHVWPKRPAVLSDNRGGLRMLVDYAVSLGHSRIAFIHGQMNSEVTKLRVREYLDAMGAHNLPVPEGYLVEGCYEENEALQALVNALLDRPDRPTCILLPDDVTYFGAQKAIWEHELRIPVDVSVAGYDGIRLTQSLRPQLTTIKQDSEAMGREAARRLIEHVEHPEITEFEPVNIPVSMIKGATIGWCEQW